MRILRCVRNVCLVILVYSLLNYFLDASRGHAHQLQVVLPRTWLWLYLALSSEIRDLPRWKVKFPLFLAIIVPIFIFSGRAVFIRDYAIYMLIGLGCLALACQYIVDKSFFDFRRKIGKHDP